MKTVRLLSLLLSLLFVLMVVARPANAGEHAKWFVLRDHQTGYCWPALLVAIDGGYAHGFAQRAGGPYDREADAQERREVLKSQGTCRQD